MNANMERRQDDVDLLAWNVANEVISGFAAPDFDAAVGASPEVFRQLDA